MQVGMAALVRNRLNLSVCKVDLSVINECWIELQFFLGIAIVGCYFPPPDSPYFALDDLASLQYRIRCAGKKCLLIGDMNAHGGVQQGVYDSLTLLKRATDLCEHAVMHLNAPAKHQCRRGIPVAAVHSDTFRRLMAGKAPPYAQDVASAVNAMADVMYEAPKTSPRPPTLFDETASRWQRIKDLKDSRLLWKAVGWDGMVNIPPTSDNVVNDTQFKVHFEALLNPLNENQLDLSNVISNIYIPLLDDDIQQSEVFHPTLNSYTLLAYS
ncbi:hypothetical protein CAPTEDRAFT_201338 [Capitella teleta]|uniref:Endonuclease/exonuclease/phosphatase domain-containing protein n=1 Tax=Capitella teleta TaxID=283909 RepID=R7V4U7_CAPTE|nr:hypothetical protein CAPTEDRAFT_201338 [Capitella teleta]|eukprot:ELU13878.1 hypothetical protein CAPTEDRAFT_201338 [Capitella teleta]